MIKKEKRREEMTNLEKKQELVEQKIQINQKIKSIINWFNSHDYYVNKIMLGEWQETDERFINYKNVRQEKRVEYDNLQNELLNIQAQIAELDVLIEQEKSE